MHVVKCRSGQTEMRFLKFAVIFLFGVAASAHAATFTISPDMTSVSDGIQSYGVSTLPEKSIPSRTLSFNKSGKFAGFKGKLSNCRGLIDVSVGVGGGNNSYGAFCTAKRGNIDTSVAVCDDEIVGHFAVENLTSDDTNKQHLIEFIMSNCVGG